MNYQNSSKRKPQQKTVVKNKFSLFLFIIFWALILIMFSGLIITQASRYNELRAELDRIQADIDFEKAAYDELYLQLLFFDSDAYIEMLARERFGMIRSNEIVFRNIAE